MAPPKSDGVTVCVHTKWWRHSTKKGKPLSMEIVLFIDFYL